jgi:hypothetical protein
MKKENETFTAYFFRKKYKKTSLVLILMAMIVLGFEIFRESSEWWIALVFLFIGIVLVPLGAWMDYKGYWV